MKSIPAWLIAVVAVCVTSECVAQSDTLEPIHTSKMRFRIPYRFDAQEMQSLGAKEIRLYLSTNQGERWQHVQTVAPRAGKFDFQAGSQGELWFAVRTLDARNQLHPATQMTPSLKVMVDTQKPTFSLSVSQVEPGRVQLSWTADDVNLDVSKLNLEFLQEGMSTWEEVSIVAQPRGSTSWSVPEGGVVAVRGSVADFAGNVVRAKHQTEIVGAPAGFRPASSRPGLDQSVPDFSQPIANGSMNNQVSQNQPGSTLGESIYPDFTNDVNEAPEVKPNSPNMVNPFAPNLAQNQANTNTQTKQSNGFNGQFVSSSSNNRPDIVKPLISPAKSYEPETASQPNRMVRVVKSLRFNIGYKVDDVGPSGIGGVDLYITTNDGQKWYRYGNDADRRSPFQVNVPSDGEYGFSIRVRSGVGLSAAPPRLGEPPAMKVIVDRTAPQIKLLPVEQGEASGSNTINIRWNVADAHLAENPISLAYSATPNGPWEPVAGRQPNTGSYAWTVGAGVPNQVYLRLTARDQAGNASQSILSEPVIVDLSRPSARIVDVELMAPQ